MLNELWLSFWLLDDSGFNDDCESNTFDANLVNVSKHAWAQQSLLLFNLLSKFSDSFNGIRPWAFSPTFVNWLSSNRVFDSYSNSLRGFEVRLSKLNWFRRYLGPCINFPGLVTISCKCECCTLDTSPLLWLWLSIKLTKVNPFRCSTYRTHSLWTDCPRGSQSSNDRKF